MASKQTELHVDDLLNSFESRNTTNKGTNNVKSTRPDNDWGDDQEEDNNFALGLGRNQATKTKAKKKTTTKGWGDIEASTNTAPQQPAVDFAQVQESEKKKKIFNKPNGTTKAATAVVVDEEYFPSLGEDRPKQAPKKPEPTPVAQPAATSSSSGVRKFVNAKKQGAGENFVPLEPVSERTIPVVPEKVEKVEKTEKFEKTEKVEKTETAPQQRAPGSGFALGSGFQRRTEEQPKEVPTDTKFKFGGEGPRKFASGGKISFKREEEKSEQERAREEKEREVEERLAREREELAKQRENKKIAKPEEKAESPKEKTEQPAEEKRIAKFSNTKKEAEKAVKAEPVVVEKKVEVQEVVAEIKPSVPVETVEMKGALSNKGWGEGPLLKKAQKK